MEFKQVDAYRDYRAAAKAWVAANVDPQWRREQELTGSAHTWELHRRLAADGFLGAAWPKEYGGSGVDQGLAVAVFQEISKAGMLLDAWSSTLMVLSTVLQVGTEQQKRTWLPAAARGEMLVALGYTEPGSGSDAAAAKTRAIKDGDEWVINGSKMFTSNAEVYTHVFLLCRTNPDVPKHHGLSMLIVPLDSPGVEIRAVHTLGKITTATFYTDVRVADANRVGDLDGGWGVIRTALMLERGILSEAYTGSWADQGAQWARGVRRPEGGTLLGDLVVRDHLARIAIENEISGLLAARVAWMVQTGGMPGDEAAASKLYSTETGQRQLSSLRDLIGEESVLQGDDASDFVRAVDIAHRRSIVSTIGAGSSEVMREVIAERRLGLPRNRPGGGKKATA